MRLLCFSVEILFGKVLQRLDEDHNVNELKPVDKVCTCAVPVLMSCFLLCFLCTTVGKPFFSRLSQIMCALCVSRRGLTEEDLTGTVSVPSRVWTPLFYALEPFLINRSGLLGCVLWGTEGLHVHKFMQSTLWVATVLQNAASLIGQR